MTLRIGDVFKKHSLARKDLRPESRVHKILLRYVPDIKITHIRIIKGALKTTGLSIHGLSQIRMKKQEILHRCSQEGVELRDIL